MKIDTAAFAAMGMIAVTLCCAILLQSCGSVDRTPDDWQKHKPYSENGMQ